MLTTQLLLRGLSAISSGQRHSPLQDLNELAEPKHRMISQLEVATVCSLAFCHIFALSVNRSFNHFLTNSLNRLQLKNSNDALP